jgi:prepilin-type processing-associated H-X9-DG protein
MRGHGAGSLIKTGADRHVDNQPDANEALQDQRLAVAETQSAHWCNWQCVNDYRRRVLYGAFRYGSYAMNFYLMGETYKISSAASENPLPAFLTNDFASENQVLYPSQTPILSDGTTWEVVPLETDPSPTNLVSPVSFMTPLQSRVPMAGVAIPRHGNSPKPVPTSWPYNQPLPGSVNVTFFDGHGEMVRLDQLWQLYWHADYKPPAKRPGL